MIDKPGGYIICSGGTITSVQDAADEYSGPVFESTTTNMDRKTTHEIVDWIYDYLMADGWVSGPVDQTITSPLDIRRASRGKGQPAYLTNTFDLLTPYDPVTHDRLSYKTFDDAKAACESEFGITFKNTAIFAIEMPPDVEETNSNPGPYGIVTYESYTSTARWPIITPFTRTTTETRTSNSNTTNGYGILNRDGVLLQYTGEGSSVYNEYFTYSYPWEEFVSGGSDAVSSSEYFLGDTLIRKDYSSGTNEGQIQNYSISSNCINALGLQEVLTVDRLNETETYKYPSLLGVELIHPELLTSVTADRTCVIKADGRIYGYRAVDDTLTDLTDMFNEAGVDWNNIIGGPDNGPYPAFRGTDVPIS